MADMIAIVVEEYGDVKKLVAKKVPKPGKHAGPVPANKRI
jgi:hypothetical protein